MYFTMSAKNLLTALLLTIALNQLAWQLTQAQLAPQQLPNEVIHVDLLPRRNTERHHTSRYQTNSRSSLVLRRGELLSAVVHLYRPFSRAQDRLRLELGFTRSTQPSASLEDGSLVYAPMLAQFPEHLNETTGSLPPPMDKLKYEVGWEGWSTLFTWILSLSRWAWAISRSRTLSMTVSPPTFVPGSRPR